VASVHKDVQARLEQDEDAVFCRACQLFYLPERLDGQFIVHVVRFSDDPPGTEGSPVCQDCLELLQQTGKLHRDKLVVN
jgi:hypothetical protein